MKAKKKTQKNLSVAEVSQEEHSKAVDHTHPQRMLDFIKTKNFLSKYTVK